MANIVLYCVFVVVGSVCGRGYCMWSWVVYVVVVVVVFVVVVLEVGVGVGVGVGAGIEGEFSLRDDKVYVPRIIDLPKQSLTKEPYNAVLEPSPQSTARSATQSTMQSAAQSTPVELKVQ